MTNRASWHLCALTLALAAGCAAHADEPLSEEEPDELVSKSADVKALDAMVDEINGYRSLDDFTLVAPKAYPKDLDTRFLQRRCPSTSTQLAESGVREVTREKLSKRVRQLTRAWSTLSAGARHTVHESAVYDSLGKLRVVVLDIETDHQQESAYMAKVQSDNLAINAKLRALGALNSNEKKLQAANLGDTLRTSESVSQLRFYYSAGVVSLRTVRNGLEFGRMHGGNAQYAVGARPPVVYDEQGLHPSPAKSRFVMSSMFPAPVVQPVLLPEFVLPTSSTWPSRVLTKPSDDPEVILRTAPECR